MEGERKKGRRASEARNKSIKNKAMIYNNNYCS
jgi:hypothetical protein